MKLKSADPEAVLPPHKQPEVIAALAMVHAAQQQLEDRKSRHRQLVAFQEADDGIENARASLALPAVEQSIQQGRVDLAAAERRYDQVSEQAKGPWREYWEGQLQQRVVALIDTLRGEAFQANEDVRRVWEAAAAAGCRFTVVHWPHLEQGNLDDWVNVARREVGLPSED